MVDFRLHQSDVRPERGFQEIVLQKIFQVFRWQFRKLLGMIRVVWIHHSSKCTALIKMVHRYKSCCFISTSIGGRTKTTSSPPRVETALRCSTSCLFIPQGVITALAEKPAGQKSRFAVGKRRLPLLVLLFLYPGLLLYRMQCKSIVLLSNLV